MANLYWHHVSKYSPLMGHVGQSNLDSDPIILLEITGTQALTDLMNAGHLSYILMAAPRIASVTSPFSPIIFEDFDNAVAIIMEHNSQYKKNWRRRGIVGGPDDP